VYIHKLMITHPDGSEKMCHIQDMIIFFDR
jgi:hypothetical protein